MKMPLTGCLCTSPIDTNVCRSIEYELFVFRRYVVSGSGLADNSLIDVGLSETFSALIVLLAWMLFRPYIIIERRVC